MMHDHQPDFLPPKTMMRRLFWLTFIVALLFFSITGAFRSSVQVPDEEYVLLVTRNLVEGKSLALPEGTPIYEGAVDRGRDGRMYSSYQIGQSLVFAPFYWAISTGIDLFVSKKTVPIEFDVWKEIEIRKWISVVPLLLSSLICALFFALVLRLNYRRETAFFLTVFLATATMIWPYSRILVTEVTQTFLLLATVYILLIQKQSGGYVFRWMSLAGAAFGFLLSIRVVMIGILPVLVLYWFYQNRDKRIVKPVLSFALWSFVFFLPQLIYDQVRFGNLLNMGYGSAGFSTPLYVGLYGFLFSSGKSFVLYNLVIILSFIGWKKFHRKHFSESLLFFLISVIILFKYAGWWLWSGDPAWGPRYLLVLVPFLLVPAAEVIQEMVETYPGSLWRRCGIAAVAGLSMAVQVLAVSIHFLYYVNYLQRNASLIARARYAGVNPSNPNPVPIRDRFLESEFIPEYSPILGQFWLLKAKLRGDETPGRYAPWSGLGYTSYHSDVKIKLPWDPWVLRLIFDEFEIRKIKALLVAAVLILLLFIFGREYVRNCFPERDSEEV